MLAVNCKRMKEQILEAQNLTEGGQNGYSNHMAEPTPETTARASQEPQKTQVEKEQVVKGMQEAKRRLEEKEGVVTKGEARPTTTGQETQQPKEKPYFREIPSEPALAQQVAVFCAEAEGKPLEKLTTDFLTTHYFLLREKAEEVGRKDLGFLFEIKKELISRGINIESYHPDWSRLLKPPMAGGEQREREVPENIVLPQGLPEDSALYRRASELINELNRVRRLTRQWNLPDLINAHGEISRLIVPEDQRAYRESILGQIQEIVGEAEEEREEERRIGWYGERKLIRSDKEMIKREIKDMVERGGKGEEIDYLFNRMFDRAETNPRKSFENAMDSAGRKEYTDFTNYLNELREKATSGGEKEQIAILIQRYSAEHEMRRILHDAYFIAETGGEAKDFAGYTSQFASEFLDMAFLEAPEVEVALRLREQALYQIKRENNGRIPYEKVAFIAEAGKKGKSEWDDRSKKMLEDANKKGILGREPLPEWKVERALAISRGLGMVLLRFPSIVAECPLNVPVSGTPEALVSIPWEKISWELNPLDHKVKRYDIGGKMKAIFYASIKRKKPWYQPWNQDELDRALDFDAVSSLAGFDDEERAIDERNLCKIGGWETHSTWRAWDAALTEDFGQLRKFLGKDAGLAINSLFNRYEIKELGKEKKDFFARYKEEHPDAVERNLRDAWKKKEEELKAEKGSESIDAKWRDKELKDWQGAASRIPAVVFRVLTDPANRLLRPKERDDLLKEIFGSRWRDQVYISEIESALSLAKENLMKRRREDKDFTEVKDTLLEEDFAVIGNADLEKKARNFQRVVKDLLVNKEEWMKKRREDARKEGKNLTDKDLGEEWKKYEINGVKIAKLQDAIFKKIEDRRFPFGVTTEDLPYGEFCFAQTGGRGVITRRNADWYQDVQANEAIFNELLCQLKIYKSPEEIVAQLFKIYNFARVHDEGRAQDLVVFLARGIIRLYEKDGILKIPIFGEVQQIINAIRHRGSSFAQTIYGGKAMEWEADDIHFFTEQLRQIIDFDKVKQLRKETGGTLWHAILKKTKVALYLLLLFGTYEMIEQFLKQK